MKSLSESLFDNDLIKKNLPTIGDNFKCIDMISGKIACSWVRDNFDISHTEKNNDFKLKKYDFSKFRIKNKINPNSDDTIPYEYILSYIDSLPISKYYDPKNDEFDCDKLSNDIDKKLKHFFIFAPFKNRTGMNDISTWVVYEGRVLHMKKYDGVLVFNFSISVESNNRRHTNFYIYYVKNKDIS